MCEMIQIGKSHAFINVQGIDFNLDGQFIVTTEMYVSLFSPGKF